MAFAGFLSSFAKPLWGFISPLVKQAGRGIASMLVSKGAEKISTTLGDKGITIQKESLSKINDNLERGRRIRQEQFTYQTPSKKVTFVQQQPYEEEQEVDYQQIKTKPIKKPQISILKKGNARYLRKR